MRHTSPWPVDVEPDCLTVPFPRVIEQQEIAEQLILIFGRIHRGVKGFKGDG